MKKKQIHAILNNIPNEINVPTEKELMDCEKGLPIKQWNALKNFVKSPNQSEESFHEQKFVVSNALCSIKSYAQQFGTDTNAHIKNTNVHGRVPVL